MKINQSYSRDASDSDLQTSNANFMSHLKSHLSLDAEPYSSTRLATLILVWNQE